MSGLAAWIKYAFGRREVPREVPTGPLPVYGTTWADSTYDMQKVHKPVTCSYCGSYMVAELATFRKLKPDDATELNLTFEFVRGSCPRCGHKSEYMRLPPPRGGRYKGKVSMDEIRYPVGSRVTDRPLVRLTYEEEPFYWTGDGAT